MKESSSCGRTSRRASKDGKRSNVTPESYADAAKLGSALRSGGFSNKHDKSATEEEPIPDISTYKYPRQFYETSCKISGDNKYTEMRKGLILVLQNVRLIDNTVAVHQ